MKKILLVSGHKNIGDLTTKGLRSWRDVETLKRGTGARGERDYQWEQVAPKLKAKLDTFYEVTITDAIYHEGISNGLFDLVIALHYDGGGDENRCMISAPNKTLGFVNDEAQYFSEQFCDVFRRIYPPLTGTINRDNRITVGMTDYYYWDFVNLDSPSVIIEEFNHTSQRGTYLKEHPEEVVDGIYKSVLEFFGDKEGQSDCEKIKEKLDTCEETLEGVRNSRDRHEKRADECELRESEHIKEIQGLKGQIEDLTKSFSDITVEHQKELAKKDTEIEKLKGGIKNISVLDYFIIKLGG